MRRLISAWAVLVLLGLALSGATPARAQSIERIKVDFDVAAEETPQVLCVLTRRKTTNSVLVSVLAQKPSDNVNFADVTSPHLEGAKRSLEQKRADCKTSRDRKGCEQGLTLAAFGLTEAFGRRVPDSSRVSSLGRDGHLCQPSFTLPRPADAPLPTETPAHPPERPAQPPDASWYVTCGVNQQHVGTATTAVLRLEPPPEVPGGAKRPNRIGVRNVSLDGTIASLDLEGSLDNGDYVVATVVGGDYLSGRSVYNTPDGRVHLSLLARCTQQRVAVPEGMHGNLLLRMDYDGRPYVLETPWPPTDGHVSVTTPRIAGEYLLHAKRASPQKDRPGVVRSAAVQEGTPHPAITHSAPEAEARWRGGVPLPLPVLQRKNLTFSWKRFCLYGTWPVSADAKDPENWCPNVELVDVSATCTGVRSEGKDVCEYTCSASAGEFVRLPVSVRFRGHTEQETWSDIVLRQQQMLDSYVPPEHRQISLHRQNWRAHWEKRARADDNRPVSKASSDLETIEITAPSGRVYRVAPNTDWLAVPGVTCSDSFSIQPKGELWRYDAQEGVALHDDGTLAIANPDDYADELAWGLVLHAGPSALFNDEFHVDRAWAGLALLLRYRPLSHTWAVEARGGALLSRRVYWLRYTTPTDSPASPQVDTLATWYIHAPLELHFPIAVDRDWGWALGPFLGVGLGHPTPESAKARVGEFDLSVTAGLTSRHALSPKLSFEIIARGFWFEEMYVFDTDARGTVARHQLRRHGSSSFVPRYGLLGFGIRFGDR